MNKGYVYVIVDRENTLFLTFRLASLLLELS